MKKGDYLRGLSRDDAETIENQLGRRPTGAIGVAARCPVGHPLVVVTYPLRFRRPGALEVFPTLYWLTCPDTSKAVARLEAKGLVKVLSERFQGGEKWLLEEAHREYAQERMALLLDRVKDMVKEKYPAQFEIVKKTGVGGARPESRGIKCLHTHLAHYLAGGNNAVGEEVWRRLLEGGFVPCGK